MDFTFVIDNPDGGLPSTSTVDFSRSARVSAASPTSTPTKPLIFPQKQRPRRSNAQEGSSVPPSATSSAHADAGAGKAHHHMQSSLTSTPAATSPPVTLRAARPSVSGVNAKAFVATARDTLSAKSSQVPLHKAGVSVPKSGHPASKHHAASAQSVDAPMSSIIAAPHTQRSRAPPVAPLPHSGSIAANAGTVDIDSVYVPPLKIPIALWWPFPPSRATLPSSSTRCMCLAFVDAIKPDMEKSNYMCYFIKPFCYDGGDNELTKEFNKLRDTILFQTHTVQGDRCLPITEDTDDGQFDTAPQRNDFHLDYAHETNKLIRNLRQRQKVMHPWNTRPTLRHSYPTGSWDKGDIVVCELQANLRRRDTAAEDSTSPEYTIIIQSMKLLQPGPEPSINSTVSSIVSMLSSENPPALRLAHCWYWLVMKPLPPQLAGAIPQLAAQPRTFDTAHAASGVMNVVIATPFIIEVVEQALRPHVDIGCVSAACEVLLEVIQRVDVKLQALEKIVSLVLEIQNKLHARKLHELTNFNAFYSRALVYITRRAAGTMASTSTLFLSTAGGGGGGGGADADADAEWMNMTITPTPHELLTFTTHSSSPLYPYNLPRVHCRASLSDRSSYESPDEYLRTYSNLMRANALTDISNAIHAYRSDSKSEDVMKAKRDVLRRHLYRILEVPRGVNTGQHISVQLRISLPNQKCSSVPWTETNRLMLGNLLAISLSGEFTVGEEEGDIVWAVVSHAPASKFSREQQLSRGDLYVTLVNDQFATPETYAKVLAQLLGPTKSLSNAAIIESPTFFAASSFALHRLRDMSAQPLLFGDIFLRGYSASIPVPEYLMLSKGIDVDALTTSKSGKLYALDEALTKISSPEVARTSTLDPSQLAAVSTTLTQPVVLIQGPPGTGKTHVAVTLYSLLFNAVKQTGKPMLIIAQKNHALDELLLKIRTARPGAKCLRLGGGCKDESLQKECSLKALLPYVKGSAAAKMLYTLKDRLAHVVQDLNTLAQYSSRYVDPEWWKIVLCSATASQVYSMYRYQQASRKHKRKGNAAKEERDGDAITVDFTEDECKSTMDAYKSKRLEDNDENLVKLRRGIEAWLPRIKDVKDALVAATLPDTNVDVPAAARTSNSGDIELDQVERQLQLEKRGADDDDDDAIFGEDNRPTHAVSTEEAAVRLTQEVCLASDLKYMSHWDSSLAELGLFEDIASLKPLQKLVLLHVWRDGTVVSLRNQLHEALQELKTLHVEYTNACAREKADRLLAGRLDIVACTVTGAAKQYELIERLKPVVALVEEAAEVMEPTLIAGLPSTLQHLIMIGDHQQLRPQVNVYPIQKVNRLDVSLFERLAELNSPASLIYQRRMLSTLSVHLKGIYPSYTDNTAVSLLEPLPCLAKPLSIWQHSFCENASESSFINKEEATLVCGLLFWLFANGVEVGRITILCAYQAQSVLVRRLLRSHEAVQATRVCTIDDYQGEENDVIIVSLVRGHSGLSAGFMKAVNRFCVTISRARLACVIIGNSRHLRNLSSTPHWNRLTSAVPGEPAIPLRCCKHPLVTMPLDASVAVHWSDANLAFMGIESLCKELCNEMHSCGIHRCRKCCHQQTTASHKMCKEPVIHSCGKCAYKSSKLCSDPPPVCTQACCTTLSCGHKCTKPCGEPCVTTTECKNDVMELCTRCTEIYVKQCGAPRKCSLPCKVVLPCGHTCPHPCSEQCVDNSSCPECIRFRKAEIVKIAQQRLELLQESWSSSVPPDPTVEKLDVSEPSHEEHYNKVHTAVMKSIQADHMFDIEIIDIFKVTWPRREQERLEAVKDAYGPVFESTHLFHGTRFHCVESILKDGFKVSKDSKNSKRPSMFGPAVYLTPDSSKAAQEIYTGSDEESTLLYCDVYTCRVERFDREDYDAATKRHEKRFDTAYAVRDMDKVGGVRFDEYAVYDERLVMINYVVRFKRKHFSHVTRMGQDFYELLTPPVTAEDHFAHQYRSIQVAFAKSLKELSSAGPVPSKIVKILYSKSNDLRVHFKRYCGSLDDHYRLRKGFVYDSAQILYHGPGDGAAIPAILRGGFKTGGIDVAVKNGQVHGRGIYTTKNIVTALQYAPTSDAAAKTKWVIASYVALHQPSRSPWKDKTSATAADAVALHDGGDHHEVVDFCTVVFHERQLLPLWAIEIE